MVPHNFKNDNCIHSFKKIRKSSRVVRTGRTHKEKIFQLNRVGNPYIWENQHVSVFIQKENRSEWKINLSKECERVKKRNLKKMERGRGRTQLSKWILIAMKVKITIYKNQKL